MGKSKLEKKYNFEYGKKMANDVFVKMKDELPKLSLEEFNRLCSDIPNFNELIEKFIEVYKETIQVSEKMSSKDKEENTKTIQIIMEAIKSKDVSDSIKSQLIKGPLDKLIVNQKKMSKEDKKYLKKGLYAVLGLTLLTGVLYLGNKAVKMKRISKYQSDEDNIIDVEFDELAIDEET